MSKLPPQYHKWKNACLAGVLVGGGGIFVADRFGYPLLSWVGFAVSMLSFIGLTAATVYYTSRYLNSLSKRD